MQSDIMAPARTNALAADVEGLIDSTEPEGTFRDSRECGVALTMVPLLLVAPPTPRPKTQTKAV